MADQLSIDILGAGGAFDPLPTSYLVLDELLVDCGLETVKLLLRSGQARNIRYLYITHLHQDHVAGLEAFLFYQRLIAGNEEALTILAGPDFLPYYQVLKVSRLNNGDYVEAFRFVPVASLPEEGIALTLSSGAVLLAQPLPGRHCSGTVPVFGLRLVFGAAEVMISSDTDGPFAHLQPADLQKPRFLCFHDMGWTSLPKVAPIDKVHPTEAEVLAAFGPNHRIIGIHTCAVLQHYRQAKAGDVFRI